MQRNELLAGILAALVGFSAPAQDAATASAERDEQEANFKRMTVKVEGLEEAFRAQQKTIAELVAEVHNLRSDIDRLKSRNESAAIQESIKALADKITEVDKNRRSDGELVSRKFADLQKGLAKAVVPAPRDATPPPVPKPDKPEKPDKAAAGGGPPPGPGEKAAYEYKIKEGDTLQRIVTEFRAQNFKVTQKQIMDVNPKVNWNRLRVGQTIFIPAPTP